MLTWSKVGKRWNREVNFKVKVKCIVHWKTENVALDGGNWSYLTKSYSE